MTYKFSYCHYSSLNDLIETRKDGEEGFRACAEDIKDALMRVLKVIWNYIENGSPHHASGKSATRFWPPEEPSSLVCRYSALATHVPVLLDTQMLAYRASL
jgi:hypothetical protein